MKNLNELENDIVSAFLKEIIKFGKSEPVTISVHNAIPKNISTEPDAVIGDVTAVLLVEDLDYGKHKGDLSIGIRIPNVINSPAPWWSHGDVTLYSDASHSTGFIDEMSAEVSENKIYDAIIDTMKDKNQLLNDLAKYVLNSLTVTNIEDDNTSYSDADFSKQTAVNVTPFTYDVKDADRVLLRALRNLMDLTAECLEYAKVHPWISVSGDYRIKFDGRSFKFNAYSTAGEISVILPINQSRIDYADLSLALGDEHLNKSAVTLGNWSENHARYLCVVDKAVSLYIYCLNNLIVKNISTDGNGYDLITYIPATYNGNINLYQVNNYPPVYPETVKGYHYPSPQYPPHVMTQQSMCNPRTMSRHGTWRGYRD